jgi:hypothetical protein
MEPCQELLQSESQDVFLGYFSGFDASAPQLPLALAGAASEQVPLTAFVSLDFAAGGSLHPLADTLVGFGVLGHDRKSSAAPAVAEAAKKRTEPWGCPWVPI